MMIDSTHTRGGGGGGGGRGTYSNDNIDEHTHTHTHTHIFSTNWGQIDIYNTFHNKAHLFKSVSS